MNTHFIHSLTSSDLHHAFYVWTREPARQRFGQYFCNRYLLRDFSWPELFYEPDPEKAYSMIYEEINK